jgi:hypothetical protein
VNTKAAVLGTEASGMLGSEREMLLAALTSGLKERAGYIPMQGVFTDDGTPHKRGELISVGVPNDRFILLDELSKFCAGWGWIAGSAALWRYQYNETNVNWSYNDIDIFCHSESAYDAMRKKISDGDVSTENERSVKARGFRFTTDKPRWADSVNLIKPLPSDNWLYPANVLAGFDLTCCAVALIQPGVVFALHPDDVRKKLIGYVGETISPVATVRRVFKYMKRGYKPNISLWIDMANDERILPVLSIFDELRQAASGKEIIDVVEGIYHAVPYEATYSSYTEEDEYDPYDDY